MKTSITIASAVAGARNLFGRLARGAAGYARRAIAAGNDLGSVSQTSHHLPRRTARRAELQPFSLLRRYY
jgi:hypothetical protein